MDPPLPAMPSVLGVVRGGAASGHPLAPRATACLLHPPIACEPVAAFPLAGMLSALDARIIRQSRRIPAAADRARLGARVFGFELRGARIFRPRETGSAWNIRRRTITGPLASRQPERLDSAVTSPSPAHVLPRFANPPQKRTARAGCGRPAASARLFPIPRAAALSRLAAMPGGSRTVPAPGKVSGGEAVSCTRCTAMCQRRTAHRHRLRRIG